MSNIKNKVVAITGASSGIGEAIAHHLAEKGAKLIIGARREYRLISVAKEIELKGGTVVPIIMDVTKKTDLQRMVDLAVDKFGKLDVLVSNAGLMPLSYLHQCKTEEWDRMIDVNVKGVLYGIAAALPLFQKQNSGHFINITSVADRWVGPTSTVYSATKYAVRIISEGLRQETDQAIRVTIVAPGATESELPNTISDPELKKEAINLFRKDLIPASTIAEVVGYAIEQPSNVSVNELVVRPTAQRAF